MPGHELLRCLAVRVLKDAEGEIDSLEFEAFLNNIGGRNQWISTTEWLFVDPPVEADGFDTLPVVMPEAVAVRAVLNDLTNEPQRIVFDHQVKPAEGRKWRWVAFQIAPNAQGQCHFPWERFNA